EDGIRDRNVTGVQTCALPILRRLAAGEHVSLLGKWLPSVNASNRQTIRNAKKVARAFGMSEVSYRKAVSALRRRIHIIENDLREIGRASCRERGWSGAVGGVV